MTDLHLYLVRHGRPEQHILNPGLSEVGHQQAALLGEWVKRHIVCKAIFASDMQRARETAAYLDENLPVPLSEEIRLREYTGWNMQGQPCNLLESNEKHESWTHFCTRIKGFLNEVTDAYRGQSVIWVAHGGVFDVMIATVLKLGTSHTATTFVHHTGISQFHYTDRSLELVFHNRTDHLPDDLKTY